VRAAERVIIVNPREDIETLKAIASEVRIDILDLLSKRRLNVNEIADALALPQSTVATHIAILEKAGLIVAESSKAKRGSQKICSAAFEEMIVRFPEERKADDSIVVEMPIGLFTNYYVTAPCGLCSTESIIGFLDVPDSFLTPDRMRAGLLWCETGFVEYKFPNNALYKEKPVSRLELSAELSSETPGTNRNWLSDITLWINNVEVGSWTSPGDFGDKRGKYTPLWWKLEGSQYGLLKHWIVTDEGAFVDGVRISDVCLEDLKLAEHHSIRVKIGVKDDAAHPGGMNIFGRGFGNYNQGIVLNLRFD
jgi:predicted transcriptional regulator